MWLLGLDIGQCSTQQTNGSPPVHGNQSVRRTEPVVYKERPGFYGSSAA